MDTIKKMWDNPISKKVIIVMGAFIIIIIIVLLITSCSVNQKYTPEELETKIVNVSKTYYKNNKSKLPKKNGDYITISLQKLVDNNLIKPLDKILDKDTTCRGDIKIINNNGYYLYIPELDCGSKYKYQTIYDVLTKSKNIATEGNGLYEANGDYIFKGDTVNNYLKINDLLFRIIRINSDGSIKVLDTARKDSTSWDDRYNVEKGNYSGINSYVVNDVNSRIKDSIESIYKTDETYTTDDKAYFKSGTLCIGKRSVNDNLFDQNIECSETLENEVFGTLLASDFYDATLDKNCTEFDSSSCLNYNYIVDIGSTWTLTADKDTSYKAFKISTNGIALSYASTVSSLKITATLNKDILYQSGNGSEEKPYIIKTFSK